MKILVTGGAGYIGSHTNRLLNEKGFETVVLDDLSDGHREAVTDGEFVEGDFGDQELLDKLMTENRFDAVFHFAAFASVPDSVIHWSVSGKNIFGDETPPAFYRCRDECRRYEADTMK